MMVGLDIDGVLADFLSPFLRIVEKKIGNDSITLESIDNLTLENHSYLWETMA